MDYIINCACDSIRNNEVELFIEKSTTNSMIIYLQDEQGEDYMPASGSRAKMTIRKRKNSTTNALQLDLAITREDITSKPIIKINIKSTDTTALTPGRYYYDVVLAEPGENSNPPSVYHLIPVSVLMIEPTFVAPTNDSTLIG